MVVLKLGLLLLSSAALASAACSGTDLALGASATASSAPCGEGCAASNAVDGAAGSRWESAQSDPQWLAIDLGAPTELCEVAINWEGAYASAYDLQVSDDGEAWTTAVAAVDAGGAGWTTTSLPGGTSGRWLRVYGSSRGTIYGYSFYTLSLYGAVAPPSPPAPPAAPSPCTALEAPQAVTELGGVGGGGSVMNDVSSADECCGLRRAAGVHRLRLLRRQLLPQGGMLSTQSLPGRWAYRLPAGGRPPALPPPPPSPVAPPAPPSQPPPPVAPPGPCETLYGFAGPLADTDVEGTGANLNDEALAAAPVDDPRSVRGARRLRRLRRVCGQLLPQSRAAHAEARRRRRVGVLLPRDPPSLPPHAPPAGARAAGRAVDVHHLRRRAAGGHRPGGPGDRRRERVRRRRGVLRGMRFPRHVQARARAIFGRNSAAILGSAQFSDGAPIALPPLAAASSSSRGAVT